MSSDRIETFRSSVSGSVTLHETGADGATETIAAAVEQPAVGVGLPFEGVSLPETVETEFSPSSLRAAATGVTPARHAIATYGTVTLPSDSAGSELASLSAPRHVAVVAASAVVPDMATAYERLDSDIGDAGSADERPDGGVGSDERGSEHPGGGVGSDERASERPDSDIGHDGGVHGGTDDGTDTQILATGPSATADMGTLVEGVHGPDEVHVVLLEDR